MRKLLTSREICKIFPIATVHTSGHIDCVCGEDAMPTVCMQAIVCRKTVQVVLSTEKANAKIFIVDSDGSSRLPRTMSVQEYIDSGMSSEETVRHILEIVTAAIEQMDQAQGH
ncbi:hypothetical protein [Burkholderia contaminans]|uniref:hypothetical protein n=1 Tax=Burkholderia contaminans TaxID=488447 RepID=UPI001F3E0D70|nr:hypothetical protein [Burkholderia contaminans]MEB4631188.1 hypothetical protein [Burkholderia contaminans]MEB4637964.1 hypothetical protein [Burkholderia contaminans]MEB4653048.1 hypothetical protein [Burkholderia contaminans]MEB4658084.1 hypothetical protein [Burkholderia contaminans]MEB4668326.1 hypothetical protein [Burkholderia contaminans]